MAGWTVVPNGDTSAWKPVATPISTDPSGRTPTGEPAATDGRNFFQRALDNLTTPDPRREEWQSPLRSGIDDFAQHVASSVAPLISHPAQSAAGLAHAMVNAPSDPGGFAAGMVQPLIQHAAEDYQQHGPVRGTSDLLGTGAGLWATGEATGAAIPKAMQAGSAIRDAAIGDPNVAALKGLRVGAASPKSLSTIKSVEGARPYLQGVQSLEDAQTRIPAAKAEIWAPYQDAITRIGSKPVMGPDGPTTVGDLENERLQISANLRTLKSGTPEGIQLAAQKGMNQADLLAREKAVQAALDPHLEAAGVDPKAIRGTFGNVAQVGGRLSGKSTLAEADQPYGFGKIAKIDFTHPLQAPANIASGVRDLAAGRPWWSGKPTDINLREAFRTGGPKPDFRAPASAMPWEQPPKQLSANVPGNAGYGDVDPGSMVGLPHPGPSVTPAPLERLQLPASAGAGEAQPMVRYAKPYVEPYDPHFRPLDVEDYQRFAPKKKE